MIRYGILPHPIKTIPLYKIITTNKIERQKTMNENINNTVAAQNVNTEATETAKVSLGQRVWGYTKTAAKATAIGVTTVAYVTINVAAIALPLAACVKYLRED